jgi:hypothetical protein
MGWYSERGCGRGVVVGLGLLKLGAQIDRLERERVVRDVGGRGAALGAEHGRALGDANAVPAVFGGREPREELAVVGEPRLGVVVLRHLCPLAALARVQRDDQVRVGGRELVLRRFGVGEQRDRRARRRVALALRENEVPLSGRDGAQRPLGRVGGVERERDRVGGRVVAAPIQQRRRRHRGVRLDGDGGVRLDPHGAIGLGDRGPTGPAVHRRVRAGRRPRPRRRPSGWRPRQPHRPRRRRRPPRRPAAGTQSPAAAGTP